MAKINENTNLTEDYMSSFKDPNNNITSGSTREGLGAILEQLTKLTSSLNDLAEATDKAKEKTKELTEEQEKSKSSAKEVKNILSSLTGDGGLAGKGISSVVDAVSEMKSGGNAALVVLKEIAGFVSKISNNMTSAVENAVTLNTTLMPKIDTRLQGLTLTTNEGQEITSQFYQTFFDNSPNSPYYSLKSYVENISSLVGQGIAYDVEERAMLKTVGEKIVTTFEVTNSTLLSLVKIQQTDSTAAYMGSEKTLTQVLNAMFQDTSYLNSSYDTNWAKLLNASSYLSTDEAVQFQFNVQKWLGALSSVGVSDTATGNIATAIGKIGSGDVSNLSTLLTMAASQSGVSLGSILSEGFTNATDVDSLMVALINILQNYSGQSNVVKNQLASLFGLSGSDFTAINNLTNSQISTLSSIGTNYATSTASVLDNLASDISSRSTINELYENAKKNAYLSWAGQFVNDPDKYRTYFTTEKLFGSTIANLIENLVAAGSTSDIASGVSDESFTLNELLKKNISYLYRSDTGSLVDFISNGYNSVYTRGTGFTLPDGLGKSGSSLYSAVTGDTTLKYYSQAEDTTTTSTDTSTTYNLQALADKLFSDKTAIGVKVKAFDDDALDKLVEKLSSSAFDTNGNGVNDMADMLSIVRSWG